MNTTPGNSLSEASALVEGQHLVSQPGDTRVHAPFKSDPPTHLWLIRHAEVAIPYHGVYGGKIDMDLSQRGQEQAAVLARYLHRIPFDAVYASPMKRVQQTLAPFLQNGSPRPVVIPDLREVDFGVWTGLSFEQVQHKFGLHSSSWLDQLDCAGIPEAECAQTLRRRLEPCVHDILDKHRGRQVAIFCHGGVIRSIMSIVLGWPLPKMSAFQVEYASVTRLALLAHKPELQVTNFTPWRGIPA